MAVFAAKAITSSGRPVTGAYLVRLFIICLSYANLCFLNTWTEISDREYDFSHKYAVNWQRLTALTIDILIVALVAWGILYLALASGNRLWIRTVKWATLAALLVPLEVLHNDENVVSLRRAIARIHVLHISLLLLSVAAGLLLLFNWERMATRTASSLLIVLAPSMPLALANAAWRAWSGPSGNVYQNRPLQPALPQPTDAPHVVWIIFDEWDHGLTFPDRPAGLSLPEIDRFQSGAFQANRAYPPAWATIVSIPSLLTGKTFVESAHPTPSELMLTYSRSERPVGLTTESTIFSEAHRRGFNIGIAGWSIPYCRLITACMVCSWFSDRSSPADGLENSVLRSMGQAFTGLAWKGLRRVGIDFESPLQKEGHLVSYWNIRRDMLRAIVDPRLNLIFVHMNVPHLPAIYLTSADTTSIGPTTTYADNLRLVDRTIRDLRETLEESGMWDTSTILLVADHPLKPRSWKSRDLALQPVTQHANVPFLLKMPGQKQGLAYNKPMQEIVTKDLLLAIMDREVTTPEQVAAWLDHNPPRQQ